jgi:hypothetical protein
MPLVVGRPAAGVDLRQGNMNPNLHQRVFTGSFE